MKAKIVGAALGAALMTCGWASGAQAFALNLQTYFYLAGEIVGGGASVNINSDNTVNLTIGFYRSDVPYDPIEYTVNVIGDGFVKNKHYVAYDDGYLVGKYASANFFIKNAHITGYFDNDGNVTKQDYYSSISGYALYGTETFGGIPQPAYGYVNLDQDFYFTNVYQDVLGGSFDVTTVPIPSSAPLFGAALSVLASLGYAIKRRSRLQAV